MVLAAMFWILYGRFGLVRTRELRSTREEDGCDCVTVCCERWNVEFARDRKDVAYASEAQRIACFIFCRDDRNLRFREPWYAVRSTESNFRLKDFFIAVAVDIGFLKKSSGDRDAIFVERCESGLGCGMRRGLREQRRRVPSEAWKNIAWRFSDA